MTFSEARDLCASRGFILEQAEQGWYLLRRIGETPSDAMAVSSLLFAIEIAFAGNQASD